MTEEFYITKHQKNWTALENYCENLKRNKLSDMQTDNLTEFLNLYKSAVHNLAYVQTHYPKSPAEDYLNALVAKCGRHIYLKNHKKFSFKESFFNYINLLHEEKKIILISSLIFITAILIGFIFTFFNLSSSLWFIPKSMTEGFIESAESGFSGAGIDEFSLLSSESIITNNISVCALSFVFGIFFGIPVFSILFSNGAILGSAVAIFAQKGSLYLFFSLIIPHGVFELTAIFLSGAAGLIIARGLIKKTPYTRKVCLINETKKAGILMTGTVILLLCAGLIEGLITPAKIDPAFKYMVALLCFVILIVLYNLPYICEHYKKSSQKIKKQDNNIFS